MARKPYPSDLTDKEWEVLEPLLPAHWTGHPRENDLREIVNGMLYMLRTGCQWRMLPHDLPAWPTVQYYFYRWRDQGVWEKVAHALNRRERVPRGKEADPSAVVIDSQSAKTVERAGLADMTRACT